METRPLFHSLIDSGTLALALGASGVAVRIVDRNGVAFGSPGDAAIEHLDTSPRRDWDAFWKTSGSIEARDALAAAQAGRRSTARLGARDENGRAGIWDCTFIPVSAPKHGTTLIVARDVTDEHRTSSALRRTARLHQALIEATSEIVWHYDVASGNTARSGWLEFTGRSDDEADFDDWLADLHPEDRAVAKGATDDAVAQTKALTVRYRLRHKSGEWRWMEDHAVPLTDETGAISDWIGIVSDVHAQTVAQDALRKSEERLRLAVEATGLGTWDWDIASGERQWSEEARALLGLERGTMPSNDAILQLIEEPDRRIVAFLFDPAACRSGTEVATFRIGASRGNPARWIEMRCRTYPGANGVPVRQVGTMQDVTEQREAGQRIWQAAYTDELTGLPNRSAFQLRLEETGAALRCDGTIAGLAVIDLDDFKEVNDTFGHDAGDHVLKAVAARLSAHVPPNAAVARLGGDEFAVILPSVAGPEALEDVATALAAALGPPLRYRGSEISCRGSIGFALLSHAQKEPAGALKQADIAMYAAKEAGGGRALGYHPAMSTRLERRMTVLRDARRALHCDAVMPFYQPKISLETGRIVGFEALLRWSDGTNLRSPGEIAEALDDPELSPLLGARMLQRVTADMRTWRHAGVPFGHVGLNVAAPEFLGGGFGRNILAALRDAELRADQLEVEVTESVFLGDTAAVVSTTLQDLHDADIALALDDFGTGFASLTHLRTFPVTCLKIDRSFVSNLAGEGGSAAIIETVIDLAHRLGMRVVAEGVETQEQLDFLRRNRCDAAQGFLFAKPMAASRVPHFLENWEAFGGRLPPPGHAPDQQGLAALRA